MDGGLLLFWVTTLYHFHSQHKEPKKESTMKNEECRVFLEENPPAPDYLAMFQDGVEELNRLEEHEVSPEQEFFVLSAFPDINPADIIGAELVDYDPEEWEAQETVEPEPEPKLLEL